MTLQQLRRDKSGVPWWATGTDQIGGRVQMDESGERAAVFECWAKDGAVCPHHWHPDNDETIEMLAGEFRIEVGDLDEMRYAPHVLRAGDRLEIARGVPHYGWFVGQCRFRVTFEPPHAVRWIDGKR